MLPTLSPPRAKRASRSRGAEYCLRHTSAPRSAAALLSLRRSRVAALLRAFRRHADAPIAYYPTNLPIPYALTRKAAP